jgi:N-methylhydantoinase A
METHVARPQGLSADLAAWAVSEVVEENMANAAKVHAIESGTDLRGRAMIAFGGAAPLHALHLAEKLGVERVIIPSGAGVGSAVGFLRAPISFEVVRSFHALLSRADFAQLDTMLAEMSAEAEAVVRAAAPDGRWLRKRVMYMRYAGQGHEIPIALPDGAVADLGQARLRALFEEEYRRNFGRVVPGVDLEFLTWTVNVIVPRDEAQIRHAVPAPHEARPSGRRRMFDVEAAKQIDVPVYDRALLAPGAALTGPAIIVERETSTIVTKAFAARIDAHGYIDCERIAS